MDAAAPLAAAVKKSGRRKNTALCDACRTAKRRRVDCKRCGAAAEPAAVGTGALDERAPRATSDGEQQQHVCIHAPTALDDAPTALDDAPTPLHGALPPASSSGPAM